MIRAKVLIDASTHESEKRFFAMELRYPKFIHSEFMTHRALSRNASSSRAIPTSKLLEEVRSDALRATPEFWGANQKGMQAVEELSDEVLDGFQAGKPTPRRNAQIIWANAAMRAADSAERLMDMGAHKQIVNRILEPFSHINVVVSATEWKNFFGLRLDKAAQPEMRLLAEAMWNAQQASTTTMLDPGDWALPYVGYLRQRLDGRYLCEHGKDDWSATPHAIFDLIKVSVARCARVSYRSHETGKETTFEEDRDMYTAKLHLPDFGDEVYYGVMHASPAEHQTTPDEKVPSRLSGRVGGGGPFVWRHPEQHGNFVGWRQYRKMLKGENEAPLPSEYLGKLSHL